jgi:hypothetical protein
MFSRKCPNCKEGNISTIHLVFFPSNPKCTYCHKTFITESKFVIFDHFIFSFIKSIIYFILFFLLIAIDIFHPILTFIVLFILIISSELLIDKFKPLKELNNTKASKLDTLIIATICISILAFTAYTLYKMNPQEDNQISLKNIQYKKVIPIK